MSSVTDTLTHFHSALFTLHSPNPTLRSSVPIEFPDDAGGGVRGVVVLRVLGIVQDLVEVFLVRAFHEDDVRPPLSQKRGNFDPLVLVLRIVFAVAVPVPDFLLQEALVAVILAEHRPAHELIRQGDHFVQAPVHMLMPELSVQIDLILPPAAAGKGRPVAAAVSGVDMGDGESAETVAEEFGISEVRVYQIVASVRKIAQQYREEMM